MWASASFSSTCDQSKLCSRFSCLKRALSSREILQSRAKTLWSLVTINGLISTRDKSLSKKSLKRLITNLLKSWWAWEGIFSLLDKRLICISVGKSPEAINSLKINLSFDLAISSISVPPSVEQRIIIDSFCLSIRIEK